MTSLDRFFAGGASATVVAALTQPFDVVKTTQQALRMSSESPLSKPIARTPLRSAMGIARDIFSREGMGGLYAGLGATVVRVFFGAGVYFAAIDKLSDALGRGAVASFATGALARAAAVALLSPVSVLKTRLESRASGTAAVGGSVRTLLYIARTEGPATLFSGLVPTLVRDAPFSGLYVSSYRFLRGLGVPDGAQPNVLANFVAGVGAGAFATAITHPADVLKTRLQLRPTLGAWVNGTVLRAELVGLLRAHGVRGLYDGLNARVAKRALSTALTWTLFEESMRRTQKG